MIHLVLKIINGFVLAGIGHLLFDASRSEMFIMYLLGIVIYQTLDFNNKDK